MTEALWYAARGTGTLGLVLLTVAVVVGIGSRAGRPVFGLPRFVVQLLHRNAALLATAFVAVHVTTLFFDPYTQLRLADLVLPFAGAYRPLWLGLGTVAFDLVLALLVTSALRLRLGARAWRATHWLAYACWPVAWLHGLGTGSDNGTGWLWTVAIACLAAVGAALAWRAASVRPALATGATR
jgi:sulfoxide reductase heme-binding subunit YedZ